MLLADVQDVAIEMNLNERDAKNILFHLYFIYVLKLKPLDNMDLIIFSVLKLE